MTTTTIPRPLPPDAIANLATIAEVCDVLRAWGYPKLADRLTYLASEEDLDDGDRPATLESARGFLAFFGAVESAEGKLGLACSWEGWLCAEWRFTDRRLVSILFTDQDIIHYAARKSDDCFIDINNGSEVGNRSYITAKLVESKEWFAWFKDPSVAVNSRIRTT